MWSWSIGWLRCRQRRQRIFADVVAGKPASNDRAAVGYPASDARTNGCFFRRCAQSPWLAHDRYGSSAARMLQGGPPVRPLRGPMTSLRRCADGELRDQLIDPSAAVDVEEATHITARIQRVLEDLARDPSTPLTAGAHHV
jgi:hypothetical protein